jgi:hypothetical protein
MSTQSIVIPTTLYRKAFTISLLHLHFSQEQLATTTPTINYKKQSYKPSKNNPNTLAIIKYNKHPYKPSQPISINKLSTIDRHNIKKETLAKSLSKLHLYTKPANTN